MAMHGRPEIKRGGCLLGKPLKILVGLGTIWLLVYPCVFAPLIIYFTKKYCNWLITLSDPDIEMAPPPMDSLYGIPIAFGTVLIILAMLVIYVVHANDNPRLRPASRAMWIGLFIFPLTTEIAMSIYYVAYMWTEPPVRRPLPPPPQQRRPVERPPTERPRGRGS